ncbi:MAG: LVIVD repeat-containing protein [Longimicrobiaceae bacterium]
MRSEPMAPRAGARRTAALACSLLLAAASASAQATDPRVGLSPGWNDAGQAIRNLELVSHRDKPQGFSNPQNGGDFAFLNADMAFAGDRLFLGGFNGFQVWDISNPAAPVLRKAFVCPGGQGDVSIYHNLLFVSVEETRGRVDCGGQGIQDSVSADRFRGVRIFDITDLDHPRQVAAVQTCRGSHTHTLLTVPSDPANVYIYVSGTSVVRSPNELAGCIASREDPNTALFRIEVIQVPVAAPQNARVVNSPRVFADPQSGNVAGLWQGGTHGPGTQQTAMTNQCHDVTVYPEIGLAAGACAGNGILLDIRDPVHPRRIDEVSDPNFAYWHSATFSNDGSKVLYSDEWGGGTQPRCRPTDRPQWGADAIFTRASGKMQLAGYYKLPAPQTDLENCVAHNGTLVPVPGRDILVQAWYQGGVSVFDFTDPAHPREIAFFDRGPMSPTQLWLSGYWAAYWYNGLIYGSEIGRGLDIFRLKPSELLSQNEIDAANLVRVDVLNPQLQTQITWPASFSVARAYLDQLVRDHGVQPSVSSRIASRLNAAERARGTARRSVLTALATQLDRDAATAADGAKVRMLAGAVRDLVRARG